ncbi:hypothetical protein Tco_1161179 [Tanacetum coccineum]
MLKRETRSLSIEVSRLRDELFRLRGEQSKSTATIARLEAELLCVEVKSPIHEVGSVRVLKAGNEKLVKDISSLRELSHLVEAQAFEEVVGMGLGFQLESVKDYDPDATKAFDKAVDGFYCVKFRYLDLLAYHLKRSLGFLKSLDPPSLPLRKSSGVSPSSSPFV